jgi:hypothetical protein
MNIFRRPDYRSDATQFLNQLKTQKPTLEAEQLKGRSLLWDKVIDRLTLRGFRSAKVRQKAYVYQTNND